MGTFNTEWVVEISTILDFLKRKIPNLLFLTSLIWCDDFLFWKLIRFQDFFPFFWIFIKSSDLLRMDSLFFKCDMIFFSWIFSDFSDFHQIFRFQHFYHMLMIYLSSMIMMVLYYGYSAHEIHRTLSMKKVLFLLELTNCRSD